MPAQDLVKNTEDGHPDKQQLEKALKELKTVTSHINESVRATERSKVLATLAHKGIPVEVRVRAVDQCRCTAIVCVLDSLYPSRSIGIIRFVSAELTSLVDIARAASSPNCW